MLKLLDRLAGCWLDWRTDQAVKRFPPELLELNLHKVKAGENGWQVVMSAPAVVVLADQAAALLNAGFNLAIEFGPVHASALATPHFAQVLCHFKHKMSITHLFSMHFQGQF